MHVRIVGGDEGPRGESGRRGRPYEKVECMSND